MSWVLQIPKFWASNSFGKLMNSYMIYFQESKKPSIKNIYSYIQTIWYGFRHPPSFHSFDMVPQPYILSQCLVFSSKKCLIFFEFVEQFILLFQHRETLKSTTAHEEECSARAGLWISFSVFRKKLELHFLRGIWKVKLRQNLTLEQTIVTWILSANCIPSLILECNWHKKLNRDLKQKNHEWQIV